MIDERLVHARLILKTEDGPLIITADDFDDMSEVTLHPGHPYFGNVAVWYEGGDYDCPCMEINEDGQKVRADYWAVALCGMRGHRQRIHNEAFHHSFQCGTKEAAFTG